MSACTSCGACCASFRVDFAVQELDDRGGSVPSGLADQINDTLCRMGGTDHLPGRCAALTGRIGDSVACGIYEWRPSPCREFAEGDAACDRARARHGLRPWNAQSGDDGRLNRAASERIEPDRP